MSYSWGDNVIWSLTYALGLVFISFLAGVIPAIIISISFFTMKEYELYMYRKEAHNRVHRVESQWHYEKMAAAGFIPETEEAKGMVRRYKYFHPSMDLLIFCCTGTSCDYWEAQKSGRSYKQGLWSELSCFLEKIGDKLTPS